MAQQKTVELPKGWLNTTIGDYLAIHNGKRKPISLKERAKCQGNFPYYGATGVIDYLDDYTHEGQYILIGEDGANLLSKSKSLAFLADGKYWVNNHAHTLKCFLDCPNSYIEQYINSLTLEPWVTGSAQPKLNKANLEKIPVPLAPLSEQKRIVEKLDSLLAQVDTIQQRLNNLPDIIKRFRQSVLAAAVSGKFTEQWRRHNGVKGNPYEAPELLGDLTRPERPISYGVLKPGDYVEGGITLLRIKDISSDIINIVDPHKIGSELSNQYKRTLLKGGEVLISLVGTIGRIGLVPKSLSGANVHRNLGVIAPNDGVLPKFLYLQMKSNFVQTQVQSARTGANQPLLNLGDIKKFRISVPSIEEQTEIVRLVEKYFALADTLDKNLSNAKQRVDNLTQSILAKAFKGELVPQDSNDEPADKLLERIKAARSEAEALEKAAKKAAKSKPTKAKK